eukprot:scaffold8945_cov129-Isochrysis_galbana.AAC.3
MFHAALPRLFAPNTLAMLQKPELTFESIRWRKRRDRMLQLCLITAILAAVGTAVAAAAAATVRMITRATLPPAARPLAMAVPFAAAAAGAVLVRRRIGSDVADVMAATGAPGKGAEGEAKPSLLPKGCRRPLHCCTVGRFAHGAARGDDCVTTCLVVAWWRGHAQECVAWSALGPRTASAQALQARGLMR